jgi:hypothetical protein
MMQCQGSEEVDMHLAAYGAMNKQLFTVSKKADKALHLTVSALRRYVPVICIPSQ